MIVECPRCRARYRVESELLEQDQTFKCSRCGHVFAYEAEAAAPTQPVTPPQPPRPPRIESPPRFEPPVVPPPAEPPSAVGPPDPDPEDDPPDPRPAESLSFSFPPRGATEPEGSADEEHEIEHDRESSRPAFVPREPAHEFAFGDEDERFTDHDEDEPEIRRDDQPRFVRGEDELRIPEEESTNPTRFYLTFLAALVIAYAIVSLDLLNHPARAERLLAAVPLVGDTISQDQLLQIKVHLEDVEGVYQQIKDDRSVFIVSGRAVNTSNEALKGVQIESALYDQAGKPIETKNIYCGNAMSLKIVKDLSSKEISLLQRLEPPRRFEIRPGESAGFSVVFLAPPAGVKEFTARVVSAQASLS